MYEILTKRGSCVQLIKEYAKNIVQKTFNKYVNNFSNDKMVPTLNIYLYFNAIVLGISDKYEALGQSFTTLLGDDLYEYIDDTNVLRKELIDIINDTILQLN
jgi:hypothetical protein